MDSTRRTSKKHVLGDSNMFQIEDVSHPFSSAWVNDQCDAFTETSQLGRRHAAFGDGFAVSFVVPRSKTSYGVSPPNSNDIYMICYTVKVPRMYDLV